MRALFAFIKKELFEMLRSGRLMIVGSIFILLGIMNPATAKLTPYLLKMMSDSLEETGMMISEVHVDAMTSWAQFFKNIPMGLIAFALIWSNTFTKEYQSGTLVIVLTKGLPRYKVVIAKASVMLLFWTLCYWLCYAITYGYNAYFWDNSIAENLIYAAVFWWLFGLWVIALMILFSALMHNNTTILVATAGTVVFSYITGLFARLKKFSPSMLTDCSSMLSGAESVSAYTDAAIITAILCVVSIVISIPIMNKKQL